MSLYLGIDFGTSTNLVTRWNPQNNKPEPIILGSYGSDVVFPNVIYYESVNSKFIGEEAVRRGMLYPDNCVLNIKRRFEEEGFFQYIPNLGRRLTSVEIARDIFKCIKNKVEEKFGGEKVDGVVISVPYAFQLKERRMIQEAAEQSGLNVLSLIEEPVAAALRFGLEEPSERGRVQKILIFDLGGGTFDVTVFKFTKQSENRFDVTVLTTDGDQHLGGLDIDIMMQEKLLNMIKEKNPTYNPDSLDDNRIRGNEYKKIRETAVSTKLNVCKYGKEELFWNSEYDDEIVIERIIKEDEFNQWLERSYLTKIENVLDNTMLELDSDASSIDRIILVGGTSNVPRIKKLVEDTFGKAPEEIMEPDRLVGEGAGLYCGMLLNNNIRYTFTPCVSQNIGIRWKGRFQSLIPRNTPYDFKSEIIDIQLRTLEEQDIAVCVRDHNNIHGKIHLKEDVIDRLTNNSLGIQLSIDKKGSLEYILYDAGDEYGELDRGSV